MQTESAGKYSQPPIWRRLSWRGPQRSPRQTPFLAVFLPFAAGYFLSCWIRTINGPISDGLVQSFDLGPRDLGLLTSLYFLTFALFQVPGGMLIDRYGPRRIQAALFLVAALGAAVFAMAQSRGMLMVGRALIGVGCSVALATGMKALALWLPAERRAFGNSCLVMFGGFGAMASAAPLGLASQGVPAAPGEWRSVFIVLGLACLLVTALVWLLVPERRDPGKPQDFRAIRHGLARIMRDPRFWRVAPLSASVVGAAFAIHGLWAARWLADAEGFPPLAIGRVLLTMGAALTLGALGFGLLATRLKRRGVPTTTLFAAAAGIFLAIQTVIALNGPVPPIVSLTALAPFGAITVLSFTIMGELFPPDMAGRANGALNMLHLGTAFAMQAGIGAVIACWSTPAAPPPPIAYGAGFGIVIAVQAASLLWFLLSPTRLTGPRLRLAWVAPTSPDGASR